MKLVKLLLSAVCTFSVLAPLAHAEDIDFFTDSLQATDSTQLGRITRARNAFTWNDAPVYPGTAAGATSFLYRTYTYSASDFTGAPYLQVSFFDEQNVAATFISAYANSYDPTNLAKNYLGDEGSSGNYFGTDAAFFQVILPANSALVLVVNSSSASAINQPYDVTLQAFADTEFNDPVVAPVPEPSTFVLLGTGLTGLVGAARRFRRSV